MPATMTKNKQWIPISVNNTDYEVRISDHQGRPHIVVPVVMMVEGVHSGSAGPVLHLAQELGRIPGSWNGMPVVVFHPRREGVNVSANIPEVIDTEIVGRVYNTTMELNKLKAEVWLDQERLEQISAEAAQAIQSHEPLDVSVGVFTEEEEVEGDWNGEHYNSIARNHRPDHLALLPGGTGACSWQDGCGIRVNQQKGGEMTKSRDDPKQLAFTVNQENQPEFASLKSLKEQGVRVIPIATNEMGMRSLVMNIQHKLDMMDTDSRMHFLREVFDGYFVYEVRNRGGDTTFYKREYEVVENEEIEFSSEYTTVREEVKYVDVNSTTLKRTKFNNNKKEKEVMKNAKDGCDTCKQKVKDLISSEVTAFADADQEWLDTLESEQLDKLVPILPKKEEKPQANLEPEKKGTIKDKPEVKLEDVLSPSQLEALEYGEVNLPKQKAGMVKSIMDNTAEGVWTKEELEAMKIPSLEKVFKTLNLEAREEDTDYTGLGAPPVVNANNDEEELLAPPGFSVNENKK